MDVLVVGAGDMGRWFGRTVGGSVAYADVDPAAAERAAEEDDGRAVPIESPGSHDVVCVAVPMGATTDAIAEHAPRATAALVDLSGVMTGPVEAMAEHAPGVERASLHPLFGPGNAPGRVAVVVDAGGSTVDRIRSALSAAGNELFETTPAEHDRAMETVQSRTHAALLAFALAAEPVPEPFGTPVYDRLEAVAESFLDGNPRVYADIQSTFEGAEDVATAAERVAEADPEAFEALYRSARE